MPKSKKPNRAVALKYEPLQDNAPKVVAKGKGAIAAKIIALARENGIHIHQDPDLIEVLSKLELKAEIPAELYIVIAELLGFVYALNGGKKLQ